ncbi:MAG TPA: hypothetical protein DF712_01920 [Balneola sp.]|mgnify:CR=1 FL=1|nr:hypothetical protein [Balneola sp.]
MIERMLDNLNLDSDSSVLDIGFYGLNGSNGSKGIAKRFHQHGEITGIVWIEGITLEEFITKRGMCYPNINVIWEDYYTSIEKINTKFDLIYIDMGADIQIDILENSLERFHSMLNPAGFLVTFVFAHSMYNGKEKEVEDHYKRWWDLCPHTSKLDDETISNQFNEKYGKYFEVGKIYQDKRDLIKWVTLKKK